jgi:hypothetical protein
MPGKFTPAAFAELAQTLRPVVAGHGVSSKRRDSLIEDLMFHVANFVDERTGSSFHESIFAILREQAAAPGPASTSDRLVAEARIEFQKGRSVELNILRSSLRKPALLRLNVEIALGVRDVTEIRKRIDTEARFAKVTRSRGRITTLAFKPAAPHGGKWQKVRLSASRYGAFAHDIDGLLACMRTVSAQWDRHDRPGP